MNRCWFILLKDPLTTFIILLKSRTENDTFFSPCAVENGALEKGLKQPLLITSDDKVHEDIDQDYDDSEEAPEESRLPANSIGSAYRLLTPSVKVCEKLTVTVMILDFYQAIIVSLDTQLYSHFRC